MNAEIINRTIDAMCSEIKAQGGAELNWRLLTEDEMLYEAAICIFGSQMQFEMAVATADRLRERGLLFSKQLTGMTDCEVQVLDALSQPLSVPGKGGGVRTVMPRFRNRLASLLATTVTEMYGKGHSLRRLLFAADNAKDARKALMLNVWGFGPKQDSRFLRVTSATAPISQCWRCRCSTTCIGRAGSELHRADWDACPVTKKSKIHFVRLPPGLDTRWAVSIWRPG